jgi:hypothetical protein
MFYRLLEKRIFNEILNEGGRNNELDIINQSFFLFT